MYHSRIKELLSISSSQEALKHTTNKSCISRIALEHVSLTSFGRKPWWPLTWTNSNLVLTEKGIFLSYTHCLKDI